MLTCIYAENRRRATKNRQQSLHVLLCQKGACLEHGEVPAHVAVRPEAAAVGEGPPRARRRGNAAARQLVVSLVNVHPHYVTLSHVIVEHARPLHHLAGGQVRMLPRPQRQSCAMALKISHYFKVIVRNAGESKLISQSCENGHL